jgi:hypothetical protein
MSFDMQLTRTILNDLLHSLRSNPKTGAEKRIQPRVGMRLRANLISTTSVDRPLEVWLRDISAGGIGILSNQPFPRGDTLKIILAESTDDLIPCTVAYCRRVGTGLFQIGLKFAGDLAAEQSAAA